MSARTLNIVVLGAASLLCFPCSCSRETRLSDVTGYLQSGDFDGSVNCLLRNPDRLGRETKLVTRHNPLAWADAPCKPNLCDTLTWPQFVSFLDRLPDSKLPTQFFRNAYIAGNRDPEEELLLYGTFSEHRHEHRVFLRMYRLAAGVQTLSDDWEEENRLQLQQFGKRKKKEDIGGFALASLFAGTLKNLASERATSDKNQTPSAPNSPPPSPPSSPNGL